MGLFQVFDGWSAVTAGILRAKGKQVPTLCYLFFKTLEQNFTSSLWVPY
jgi:Na+-driven multidrug efflux pump